VLWYSVFSGLVVESYPMLVDLAFLRLVKSLQRRGGTLPEGEGYVVFHF
jgi:hypothetical protein